MQKRYPFKFLDAYNREDKAFFFGREEEIAALYEMVFQSDLILLYGASGTGKTSLIQCGLASKFQSHDWLDLYIRRGSNLNASLQKALADAGGTVVETDDELAWLNEDFTSEGANTGENRLAASLRTIYLKHFRPIYLIFDQFEELYILGTQAEQQTFITSVKELLRAEQPVKLIISIREEYLGHLYGFEKAVPELLRKKLRVEPMNLNKIKQVVQQVGEEPTSNVSLQNGQEEKIGELIFEKIKGKEKKRSIPLPYLQVFLDKFYLKITDDEKREAEAVFTLDDLVRMEDIENVLRDFLDDQVIAVAQEFDQYSEQLWRILSPFVTLEGTKEPLSLADLEKRFPKLPSNLLVGLLEAFQKRRILRYTEQEELYEVAHDSLAQQIHAKRDDDEIAMMEVQRLIKGQMALKLETRAYLPEAQLRLVDMYEDRLSLQREEKAFLEASRKEANRKVQEQRHRRTLLLILGLVAIVGLAGISAWALKERAEANQERAEANQQRAEARAQQAKVEEALKTIERNERINTAEKLMSYGDNYSDLEKTNEARTNYDAAMDSLESIERFGAFYEAAIDSLGSIERARALRQQLSDRLERLDSLDRIGPTK